MFRLSRLCLPMVMASAFINLVGCGSSSETTEAPKEKRPTATAKKKKETEESAKVTIGATGGWGNLSGTFLVEGSVEAPKPLKITAEQAYCGKFADEIVDQSVQVGPTQGLANVFVFLKPGSKVDVHPELVKAAETPSFIDNTRCMFYPHAAGVWAGKQKLVVQNSDSIGQAVKIDSFQNGGLNSLIPPGVKFETLFEKPEKFPLPVLCNIHPWESAYLLILDSPYFGISDKNGQFTIKKLPAGTWEFVAWHERTGYFKGKPEWQRGRFTFTVKEGDNDLGIAKVASSIFQ